MSRSQFDKALGSVSTAHAEASDNSSRARDIRLDAGKELGHVLLGRDQVNEAFDVFGAAVNAHRAAYGADDPRTWDAELGWINALRRRGDITQAREELKRVVHRAEAALGASDGHTLQARADLGSLESAVGDLGAAEQSVRAVFDARVNALGKNHPETLRARHELVSVLVNKNELDRALEEAENVLEMTRGVYGDLHERTLGARANNAMILRRLGRHDEAVVLAERGLEYMEKLLGPDHLHSLRAKNNLATALTDAEDFDRAERMFKELTATWATRERDDDASYLVVAVNYARLLGERDRDAEAASVIERAVSRAEKEYPADFWLLEYAAVHRARYAGESLERFRGKIRSDRARALLDETLAEQGGEDGPETANPPSE